VKADLYTAQARTAGSSGLAHRTTAGFVVLTSADGDDIIALIDANQNEPNLIDQVVTMAQSGGPAAFAMLFTAGGELYLITSGSAAASLSSDSIQLSVSAVPGQVLVHSLNAGINEADVNITLHVGDISTDALTDLDLKAGTVEADWVEIAVGAASIHVAPQADDESGSAPAAPDDVEPVAIVPPAAEPEAAAAEVQFADEPEAAAAEVQFAAEPEAAAAEVQFADEPAPAEPTPVAEAPAAVVEETPEPAPTPVAPEPAPQPVPEPVPEPAADPVEVVSESAAAASPAHVGAVMVLGVACSQGHHNHPDAVYCSQCGTKMGVHHTTVLINGPRPPLGVLVVDDGTTYSLNQDLVVGREPSSHTDVVAGTATPMALTDDTLSLSRQHARIVLDDWSVGVEDLRSSNGTYLSRAGQDEAWTRLEANTTSALEPGDRLRVGGRIIQVELHHVR